MFTGACGIVLIDDKFYENRAAIMFCKTFLNTHDRHRFIFGRNDYAKSIANLLNIDGFIDDFTIENEWMGKPVLNTDAVPKDALVVAAVVLGRPLTARKRLEEIGLEHLDYFSFYRYSQLAIEPITCWHEFLLDYQVNRNRYNWIYELLVDDESKNTLKNIINFRLSYDLKYMEGFTDRQNQQYFEDFLNLHNEGEVFVDVGGFDGLTSIEFIKRCPGYSTIHFFEPEKENMFTAKEKLKAFNSIKYYEIALSDINGIMSFSVDGSRSSINDAGEQEIKTARLDDLISEAVSYIKLDIEGAEINALAGASKTILKYHPRLAVSVYHRGDDFWMIPHKILSYRNDYKLYLRHYTEGVDETVMYFVPIQD